MKRIWLENEATHPDEGRLWCEDKVWDDEDCTAYVVEDEAQAIIDEAVGLMKQALGWVRGIHADDADDAVTHLYRLRDFIAKHGKATQAAKCPVCNKNKADNQGQACDDCQNGMQRGGGLDLSYD